MGTFKVGDKVIHTVKNHNKSKRQNDVREFVGEGVIKSIRGKVADVDLGRNRIKPCFLTSLKKKET
jgi:hypothetical protein